MKRHARRIAVLLLGSLVTLVGLVLLVTPGPAVVVIPAGLAILGTEFPAVRTLLHRVLGRYVHRTKGASAPPDRS